MFACLFVSLFIHEYAYVYVCVCLCTHICNCFTQSLVFRKLSFSCSSLILLQLPVAASSRIKCAVRCGWVSVSTLIMSYDLLMVCTLIQIHTYTHTHSLPQMLHTHIHFIAIFHRLICGLIKNVTKCMVEILTSLCIQPVQVCSVMLSSVLFCLVLFGFVQLSHLLRFPILFNSKS